ncbi:NAD(P)H-binding protein, partial [Kitasatospora sp. NPDC002227]|uniref:NAD(P)H-binding protein n=1 Tax=Kitasatospora sp. NPDC002227 TaxID=3154773 RepID=UPI00331C1C73
MLLITTPTGDIGSQLVRMLLDSSDAAVRVIARDPARLPSYLRERVDIVYLDSFELCGGGFPRSGVTLPRTASSLLCHG